MRCGERERAARSCTEAVYENASHIIRLKKNIYIILSRSNDDLISQKNVMSSLRQHVTTASGRRPAGRLFLLLLRTTTEYTDNSKRTAVSQKPLMPQDTSMMFNVQNDQRESCDPPFYNLYTRLGSMLSLQSHDLVPFPRRPSHTTRTLPQTRLFPSHLKKPCPVFLPSRSFSTISSSSSIASGTWNAGSSGKRSTQPFMTARLMSLPT